MLTMLHLNNGNLSQSDFASFWVKCVTLGARVKSVAPAEARRPHLFTSIKD